MVRLKTVSIACLMLFVSTCTLAGQDEKPSREYQRLPFKVTVVDPDGAPIEGALVKPSSITIKEMPSGNLGWVDPEPEKIENLTTNEDGTVTVTYPDPPFENVEITRIGMEILHSAFVESYKFAEVADREITITLERGFQIATSAINAETGEPIKENLFGLTNRHQPVDWERKANGMLVSPVFGKEECQFRIVEMVDGKSVRFSEPLSVDPNKNSKALFRDIKLFNSISVIGALDASVARPVKNGMVSVCLADIRDEDRVKKHTAWHWMDYAKIEDDGTFELVGLPAGCELQVIAICDGWSNVPISKDEMDAKFPSFTRIANNNMFGMPQLFTIENEKEIELKMQPMASCSVKVTDEEGNPVVGAQIGLNPNQRFFHSGITTGFQSARSTARLLNASRRISSGETIEPTTPFRTNYVYHGKTNEDGGLVVDNLPSIVINGYAHHPDYDPGNGASNRFRMDLKPGDSKEVTVQLSKPND